MKRLAVLILVILLAGCSGVEWFPDSNPDSFLLTRDDGIAGTSVEAGSTTSTKEVILSGINGETDARITGGTFSVNDGPETDKATVKNGDKIVVFQVASDTPNAKNETTLWVGEFKVSFTTTTEPAVLDSTPNLTIPSHAPTAVNAEVNFDPVTISGIDDGVSIDVILIAGAGSSFSINEEGIYSTTPRTVTLGERVHVRQTAAATDGTKTYTRMKFGTVFATFSSATITPPAP